jgi:hypothetical protein
MLTAFALRHGTADAQIEAAQSGLPSGAAPPWMPSSPNARPIRSEIGSCGDGHLTLPRIFSEVGTGICRLRWGPWAGGCSG